MASLVTPANGDDVTAESVAQLTEMLSGLRNIPAAITGVNDAAAYALTLKNAGIGSKGLLIYAADGTTVLLQVDTNGVRLSPTGGAATNPATLTGAETLQNKVLDSTNTVSATVLDSDPPASSNRLLARSIVKGWAYVTVTAGVPALTFGFNVGSIADNGVGDLTVNWSRAFTTVGPVLVSAQDNLCYLAGAPSTGTVRVRAVTPGTSTLADPSNWHVIALGVN